jgi:cyanoexosortase A
MLPTGIVEVYKGCSGMKIILDMWGLAALLLVIFPTNGRQKILVPVAATFIGFAVNLVRVVIMAILLAFDNQTAFEYWHEGDGSLVFSMISVLIFGLFCFLMLRLDEEPEKQNSV